MATTSIRDLKLEAGDRGAFLDRNSQQAEQIGQAAPASNFGAALTALLKQQQQFGKTALRDVQREQAGVALQDTPQELIGASPATQARFRTGREKTYEPTIGGLRGLVGETGQTITDIKDYLKQTEDNKNKQRDDARKLIQDAFVTFGGGAFADSDPADIVAIEKAAGLPKGYVSSGKKTLKERDAELKRQTSGGGYGDYSQKQLNAITKINQDVSKNATYAKTTSMRNYADNVTASLGLGTGVADIAAINQFQKVIDEGAVTRDQDVKLIQGAQSLANTLRTKLKKLEKGEQLSPELRSQMRLAVESLYSAQVKALQKDPYIAAKTREATINGLQTTDTILGELGGFSTPSSGNDGPMSELQNDIQQAISTGDYGKKYKTREQLINVLQGLYPEIKDQISSQVYNLIPDKK